jgi:putative transposase
MTRLARVVAVGVPHHITQRGNARRFILKDESDRKVYLDLLRNCPTALLPA